MSEAPFSQNEPNDPPEAGKHIEEDLQHKISQDKATDGEVE